MPVSRLRRFVPRGLAALAVCAGLVVLGSWLLGIEAPRSLLPGFPTMKANTALSLALLGAALWIVAPSPARGTARVIVFVLLSVVGFLAVGTLLEYTLGPDLRIDELLVQQRTASAFTPYPGRMSPVTAVVFVLMSVSILTLDVGRPPWQLVSQTALHIAGALLLVATSAFIFDALALVGVPFFTTGIALPTLLAFVAIGTGILVARPERGIMRSLLDEGHEGILARRFLPVGIGLPMALGALAWAGVTRGLYPAGFGFGLMLTMLSVGLLVATWGAIRAISRSEEARAAADARLREAHASLERRVQERTAELEAATAELRRGSVTRELAKRVLDIGQREMSSVDRRSLGRRLGREAWRGDVPATLATFAEMGAGQLVLVEDAGDRMQVAGERMLEIVAESQVPTCALALGFVEGVLEARRGAPTLGVETRCRSQGHASCSFVVKEKVPDPAWRKAGPALEPRDRASRSGGPPRRPRA